jgi:hypothetical protein
MTVMLVLLCGAVVLTLPSLVSQKKEEGRQILRTAVFVQGGLGFALAVAAAVILGLTLAGAAGAIKTQGALVWLSRFIAGVTVFIAGIVLTLTLLIRLGSLKATADTRERAEKIFFSLFEFQTAVGFFCIVLAAWLLVCELLINPLLTG